MKVFSVLILTAALLMASISAASVHSYYTPLRSIVYPAAHVYSAHSSSLLTPTQEQYHTQDEFGQYAYGYREPLSAKQEVRSLDGTTRGSYSYRDAKGELQMVTYTADNDGFHVAATNLPRPLSVPQQSDATSAGTSTSTSISHNPSDTVEVTAARNAHLAAHEEAKLRMATSQSATIDNQSGVFSGRSNNVRPVELPYPVEDTPAVAIAKAEHLKRVEQEKLRNEIIGAGARARAATGVIDSQSPAAVRSALPAIYNYGYPLNTRLLATGYIF